MYVQPILGGWSNEDGGSDIVNANAAIGGSKSVITNGTNGLVNVTPTPSDQIGPTTGDTAA